MATPGEPEQERAPPPVAPSLVSKLQLLLTVVVAFAWVAVIFVPGVDTPTRVGVQGAMTLVLGAVFGKDIRRKLSESEEAQNGNDGA